MPGAGKSILPLRDTGSRWTVEPVRKTLKIHGLSFHSENKVLKNLRDPMKHSFSALSGVLLWLCISVSHAGAEVYYPLPGLVDESTGFMESRVAGSWYRGSATIARDPKLIYSCAHLFFERGKWATDYYFHRAYHAKGYPRKVNGAAPRGIHYFTSYSNGVKNFGANSRITFASDFTVLYGNTSFGTAAGWWPQGSQILRSSNMKRIVGYPARIDFTGDSGHCYQHATDYFTKQAYRDYGSYLGLDGVSTGSGNSGGPVFVRDDVSGMDFLAGVLVSGSRRSAGVVALDDSTDALASDALGSAALPASFRNTAKREIANGSTSFSSFPVEVSGLSGSIQNLRLSTVIATGHRGGLQVYLKSPGGRIHWISKHEGGAATNLTVSDADYSDSFKGCSPNGIWEVRIRVAEGEAPTTFESCQLEISAR